MAAERNNPLLMRPRLGVQLFCFGHFLSPPSFATLGRLGCPPPFVHIYLPISSGHFAREIYRSRRRAHSVQAGGDPAGRARLLRSPSRRSLAAAGEEEEEGAGLLRFPPYNPKHRFNGKQFRRLLLAPLFLQMATAVALAPCFTYLLLPLFLSLGFARLLLLSCALTPSVFLIPCLLLGLVSHPRRGRRREGGGEGGRDLMGRRGATLNDFPSRM